MYSMYSMAKPCLYMYTYKANINLTLSHALLYSFMFFKYVISILRKEKYILGRIGLWGGVCLFFWIWGAKASYF